MIDDDLGLIKETETYDIWFEPITDEINGFVIRDKEGIILQIYMPETR
jgi:hypothetical protein